MPKALEFICHDAVGYSINDSPFDRICYIAPQQKGYVNFGFFFGTGLADPKQLLEREGKQIRHVKIWTVEEAKNPALAKWIDGTWKEAPLRVAEVHAAMKNSKAKTQFFFMKMRQLLKLKMEKVHPTSMGDARKTE